MSLTYDAVVVGAGQAGPGVATYLAGQGKRVAIVEADLVGGTCLNRGCRPTKALRASARVAHMARTAAAHGVVTGPVTVDFAAAMARKDAMIDGWQTGFAAYLDGTEGLDVIQGTAHFLGSDDGLHRLEVLGGDELAAPSVFLNTGARTSVPRIPGLTEVPWLDNDRILHLTQLPEHLLVIGGSYIGLEFGQMFARFGSTVTVVEAADRLVPREDPEISAELEACLVAEGITVHTGARVTQVAAGGRTIDVTVDDDVVSCSHLLVAVGRTPNSDGLGLERVGVAVDERGYIVTDGHFRTNVDGIWALGDVNGRGAFTHTSYQDHEIVVDNLAGGSRSADDRIMTYAVFTDPPLGRVGMTEAQARAAGRNTLVATYRMDAVTKAVLDGETAGVVKILVDADTDRFVGAAVLGLFGDETVQTVSAMMHADASCRVLSEMLPVHPTVNEFWPTILHQLR